MKGRHTGFGIFLVGIGIIWFLMNIGILNWSIIYSLFDLWPLILVVIGINIAFRNYPVVRIVTWLLFLAAVVAYGYYTDRNYEYRKPGENGNIIIEKLPETKYGELELGLGGVRFNMDSATTNLIDASVSGDNVRRSIEYANGKETASISIEKDRHFVMGRDMLRRNLMKDDSVLHLNRDVVWDLNTKLGAVNGTIDMSDLKIRKMKVDVGAGKLNMIFGSGYESTGVDIKAGASALELVVPRTSGVKIKMNGALNSTNLDDRGWEKQDGYYISRNYNDSVNKIDIDISMGVGSLIVNTR